ncbi:hypothetical protein HOT36_gp26 [Ralstonia phage RPSC1]|uniref:Deoxynucleoside monophosphate kinase n=1 Tax=Ralstonia phage RPSC1 TaxID=2041351 RepID=A0A2Z2U7X1_9CAUD|nr:hypothetical protein HOT36_gp26 [Ralstonia phage RPSC1]ATN92956.1 hypothetical protein RPSC1_25 [Ralstonia phage RPSC1]
MPQFLTDHYSKQRVAVLALAADAGAGKDTFLDSLAETHPDLVNVKFADPLTEEVADMFSRRVTLADFKALRENAHDKDVKMGVFRPRHVQNERYKAFLARRGYDMDAPMSIRDHLILYGTDYVRKHLGQGDAWLLQGLARVEEVRQKGLIPVVTDVRFPNEAAALQGMGATLVSITADWLANRALDAITSKAEGLLKGVQFDAHISNVWGNPASMKGQFNARFRF